MITKHLTLSLVHAKNATIAALLLILAVSFALVCMWDRNAIGFVVLAIGSPILAIYVAYQASQSIRCFRIVQQWREWERQLPRRVHL